MYLSNSKSFVLSRSMVVSFRLSKFFLRYQLVCFLCLLLSIFYPRFFNAYYTVSCLFILEDRIHIEVGSFLWIDVTTFSYFIYTNIGYSMKNLEGEKKTVGKYSS